AGAPRVALAVAERARETALARRERHRPPAGLELEAIEVPRRLADRDRARGLARLDAAPAPPAQEPAHAREQLVEAEGLGQVVVGTLLGPAHEVLHVAPRGEDQDRRGLAARAPAPR